jgi:tetratricopeptide (TPR) repeat protein
MATSVETPRRTAQPAQNEVRGVERFAQWIGSHRQIAIGVAVALVAAAALGWWTIMSRSRTEAAASERLSEARLAFDSRNYPLAASEFSQIVENYSGTSAAAQANLLLAQVRMYQGQGQQAIDLLKRVAPSMDGDFRAQAYGLLGAAYENARQPREAAGAYEQAVQSAPYAFLKAQYLSDVGRSWVTAGDTAKALAAYKQIVSGMDSTATIAEARVRIGELSKGAER